MKGIRWLAAVGTLGFIGGCVLFAQVPRGIGRGMKCLYVLAVLAFAAFGPAAVGLAWFVYWIRKGRYRRAMWGARVTDWGRFWLENRRRCEQLCSRRWATLQRRSGSTARAWRSRVSIRP